MQCMLASSSLCPVLLLLVHFCCLCCACLFFDARARAATASPRFRLYIFLRRSLAVSRLPDVLALLLLLVLALVIPIMADAPAPAVPRQQRRKEARAQVQDDNRRVRKRIDDLEARLETMEGRQRGHDLRLQYLEAPLKLVLKKFKAPVEFWASKDAGFQAAKSAFSAAFMQEVARGGRSNDPDICWKKRNQLLRSWILRLLSASSVLVALLRIAMGQLSPMLSFVCILVIRVLGWGIF